MTIETETGSGPGPVDDEAVREALEQLDQVRVGEEARRTRKADEARAAAPAPAPGYQAPVPPPPPAPAYRPPVSVSTPYGDRPIGEIMGLTSPAIPAQGLDAYGQPPPLPQPPRDMRSLEDIYIRFTDIGHGQTVIRVNRIEPTMHGNMHTAGILGDLTEQISTAQFQQRYGGGKYKLLVIGPPRGQNRMPLVGAPSKTLAEFDLRIPGVPQIAPAEGNDMNQPYGRHGYPGAPAFYGMSPEVEIRRMELDAERERSLREGRKDEPAIYQTLSEQQREVVKVIERHANERCIGLEAINRDANARIHELEIRERELLDQKVTLQREVSDARNRTETEQLRDMKERYELQLRELKEGRDRETKETRDRHEAEMKHRMDEYVREKDRLVTDHRIAFETESRRHAEERQKLVEDVRTERDRTREQTADQIALATKEHDRNVKSLVDNYEGRLLQLKESHKDRLESLERTLRDQLQNEKASHEQERRSMEAMRSMMEKTQESSAQMRIASLEERLARAEEANDDLATENRELHMKLNKPPGEYLAEVGDVAKNLLGMKTAEEAKASGDEELSITKVAATSIKNLIEKGPEIMRSVAEMRANSPAAQQQAAAMAQQQQQAHALAVAQHNEQERQRYAAWEQQRQRQIQQQQPNPARRPGENARPPQWAQQQAPVAPRAAPPAGSNTGPRKRPAPPPTTGFPNIAPMASPVSERVGVSPMAVPVDAPEAINLPPELRPPPPPPMAAPAPIPPPPAAMAAPPPPPLAGAPAPGPVAGIPQITVEAINEFLGDLSTAIKMKISPKYFAQEFVTKITPDAAKQVLERVTAEQIIADLEANAETHPDLAASPIMTLEGKRYIKEVFKQTAQIVGGQAA